FLLEMVHFLTPYLPRICSAFSVSLMRRWVRYFGLCSSVNRVKDLQLMSSASFSSFCSELTSIKGCSRVHNWAGTTYNYSVLSKICKRLQIRVHNWEDITHNYSVFSKISKAWH